MIITKQKIKKIESIPIIQPVNNIIIELTENEDETFFKEDFNYCYDEYLKFISDIYTNEP